MRNVVQNPQTPTESRLTRPCASRQVVHQRLGGTESGGHAGSHQFAHTPDCWADQESNLRNPSQLCGGLLDSSASYAEPGHSAISHDPRVSTGLHVIQPVMYGRPPSPNTEQAGDLEQPDISKPRVRGADDEPHGSASAIHAHLRRPSIPHNARHSAIARSTILIL